LRSPGTRFQTAPTSLSPSGIILPRAAVRALFFACLIVCLASAPAARSANEPASQQSEQAQQSGQANPLKQLSLAQLGDVEVTTVSKEPEEVWQTPAAIYVLTAEDIRRSGATTIPEALRLIPGVEVARVDSDHWAIGVRGFASGFSKSLLVMIDGRSVYTPLFAGVYWDVQQVPLEDVDRIEVIRGPGGTIWGSNAVNGVINIITKSAKDTHGFLASAGGGNLDEGTLLLRYGGGNGSTFDYRAYGMAFTRGAEIHPEFPHYDEWRQQRGGFRIDWSAKPSDTLTLQGDIYGGQDGDITSLGSFTPPSQVTYAGSADVSGGNLLGRWRHEFAGGSDFQVQAYYDRTYRNELHYAETRNTFDVDLLYHQKLGRRQDFLWGLGARISPSNFVQKVAGLNFVPASLTYSLYSGFAQDQIQVVPDKLSLTVGTKIEHNSFSGFDVQPSARVLWTPTGRQTVWGAVTRAERTPSSLDTDLRLLDFLGNVPGYPGPLYLGVSGDPKFQSEQLLGYEAGYRALLVQRFYMDFAGFYNRYSDLESYGAPTTSVETSPITYVVYDLPFANGIKGTTGGFEFGPDWKPTDWWELKGAYSYLHLHTEDQPGSTDTLNVTSYNGSSPTNEIVFESLLDLPKRFEADFTYRYVSSLPAQSVSAYSTGDARVGWHSGALDLSIVGHNLFQPTHGEFGNTPGPVVQIRRTVYAKVTWSIQPR
jgi:iron complex outermembrane receptor protein